MRPGKTTIFAFLIFLCQLQKAQLSGSYSVPGTFASLASAINSLNIGGVTGPVTINIAAGYTETAVSGGYSLYTVVGSSSVNTISFQKSGTGANPVIYAYSGGTGVPSSGVQDGVWRFIGTDYVSVNGINIADLNTANPATMEFGYGFFKANTNNGCQFNEIRNCVITLKNVNNAQGFAGVYGSRGIEFVNAVSNHTQAIAPASSQGAHSYNKIYSNVIQNCNYGISLMGASSSSLIAFPDLNNDIGGTLAATGNTIINYGGITNSSYSASAVYCKGQTNVSISNNIINNNNGAWNLHPNSRLFGIALDNMDGSVTVANNTISVKSGSLCPDVFGIFGGSNGNGTVTTMVISGNLFTACSASIQPSTRFWGISNQAAADTMLFSNNTFTNCLSTATVGTTSLIYNTGNAKSSLTMSGNFLSFTFTDPNNYNGDFNVLHHSIFTLSNSTITYSNNIFGNVTMTGSLANVSYIKDAGARSLLSVINNTWQPGVLDAGGNIGFIVNSCPLGPSCIVSGNSINGFTLTAPGPTVAIYKNTLNNSEGDQVSIMHNTFSNIRATGAAAAFTGIQSTGSYSSYYYPRKLFYNNVVSNIKLNSTNGLTAFLLDKLGDKDGTIPSAVYNNTISNMENFGAITGIESFSSTTSPVNAPLIYANTINSLVAIGTVTSSGIRGVYLLAGSAGLNFYRNKITNIVASNSVNATGLEIASGTNVSVYNNIIGHINSATTPSTSFNGIVLSGSVNCNVYYNSVYLTGSSPGSACFKASPTSTVDLRNNLLVNQSPGTSTSTGLAYSLAIGANYSQTSNNNLFYAQSFYGLSPGCGNISALRLAASGRERNSVSESVVFVSTAPTASNYLSIDPTATTQVESGASPISWISTDFYGTNRNATAPDIGAVEGNYTGVTNDSLAPMIMNYNFTSPSCSQSSRTFTAQLSDISGIASGSLSPVLYYKINSGAYSATQGSLSSGSATLGTWSFNLTYSVSFGDIISWFMVAQDASPLNNLSSWPPVGFSGVNVNSITTSPAPLTYTVNMPLSGTYSVGAGGTFTSITQAANAYNKACLNGPVTFVLTNSLYTTPSEVFPITFGKNQDASATNSLLIIPNTGVNVTIRSTTVNFIYDILKFQDAAYITVDGLNSNGSSITGINTNTNYICNVINITNTTVTGPGNSHLTFRNLSITSNTNTTTFGIFASGYCDNLIVKGNYFYSLSSGILAGNNSDPTSSKFISALIENNQVGPVTSSTANIKENGMEFRSPVWLTVRNNTVSNVSSSFNWEKVGINIDSPLDSINIMSNVICNITNTTSYDVSAIGIKVYTSTRANNIQISNNMIYNVSGLSSGLYGTYGIEITSGLTGKKMKIYNNTIAMNQGSSMTSTISALSACLSYDAYSDIDLRNNILYTNVVNPGNTASRTYAVYSNYDKPMTLMDYNNYYAEGSQGMLAKLSASLSSLASVKSTFGMNLNSISTKPYFNSTSDLHINPATPGNALLDNMGSPIPGILNDFDAQVRNSSTPDMGADEFSATGTCTAAAGGTIAVPNFTVCGSSPVSLQVTNLSGGSNSLYQWLVSPTSVGTYTNVLFGSGYNTPYLNAGSLPAGNYYFKHNETCQSNSLSANSNVVLVTVVGQPTLTLSSTNTVMCSGSSSATLTASGAMSYTWNTGSTSSSIAITPTAASAHYVTYASAPCFSGISSNINIFTSANPTITTSAPSSVVCSGSTATISASGANTYSWSNGMTGATINPSPSVTTVYTVTGFSAGGCSATATRTISTSASPTITIAGSTAICAGQNLTLVASGANTYSWSNGSFSPTLIVAPTSNTAFSVAGSNTSGCVATASASIVVVTPVTPTVSAPAAICQGQSALLTVTGGSIFLWSTGSTSPSIIQSPTTTTVYSVVAGTGSCSTSASVTVFVNPVPQLTLNGNSNVCIGQTTSITASGASSYSWSTGSNSNLLIASPTVNTTYSVIGANTAGCSSTASISVTVNSVPVISVSPANATICANMPVTFTASGASTYTWAGGSNGNIFSLSPSTNTIYFVAGTNGSGCTGSGSVSIITLTLPAIGISPPAATVCAQSTVGLNASGAATYTWSNGGGNGSSASYTPFVSSVYTVSGTDAMNGCVNTQTVSVSTNSLPSIVVFGPSTVCAGQTATLIATGASNYIWNTTATTPFIIISPVVATNYLVIGTGANGCSSSTGFPINTFSLPVINATASSSLVCASSPVILTASGANTYTWSSGGNGNTVTVTPLSNTVYTVNGSNINGCASSATVSVLTNSLPLITVSPGSTTVCALSSVGFTASGAGNYTWSNGGGTGPSASFTPSSSIVYTVTGVDANNSCINSKTVAVVTNSLPVISVIGGSSVCVGQSLTLSAVGATSYSWNTAATSPSITVSPSVNTVYLVTGTNAAGCVSSNTYAVVSNSLPLITIASSSSVVCASSPVTLTANGANNYTWSVGANSNSVVVTPSITSTFSVGGTNTYGCVSTKTIAVSTLSLPIISITPASATICALSPASFTASGAGSYTWSNGGGNNASASYTPSVNSIYTVSATDALNSCKSSQTVAVVTNSIPVISINGNTAICVGQTTTLNASGATSYSWSSGATTASVSVAPTGNTSYTVYATNLTLCQSAAVVSLVVNPLPVISISVGTIICSGNSTSLVASGASGYLWNTGATSATINVSPANTTSYTVVGTNSNNCQGTATTTVLVNTSPTVSISGPSLVCTGSQALLYASGAASYSWNNSALTASITVSPITTATYTATGTNPNGCVGTATQIVNVAATPTLSVSGATTICSGGTVLLYANGASTYTWSNASTNQNIAVSPSTTTVYSLTGATHPACQNTAQVTITVNPLPPVGINASSQAICLGEPVTMTGTGALTYTWSGGVSNGVAIYPTITANYTVTGTDGNGCKNTASVNIAVNPLPTVAIISTASMICEGETATLTATGANLYNWNTGANSPNIAISPLASTGYTVTGIDPNGCSKSVVFNLVVDPCTGIPAQAGEINRWMIYPNPSNGLFYVKTNLLSESLTIEVMSTTGQQIMFAPITGELNLIDLGEVTNGLYMVRIMENGKTVRTERIIKQ